MMVVRARRGDVVGSRCGQRERERNGQDDLGAAVGAIDRVVIV